MSAPDKDDGLDEVGAALRERLHQAVSGLEPGPGTLDYLRRAVPARRRRRHAALAATAVSVFAVSAGATLAARGSFDGRASQANGTNVGNLMTTATNDAPGGGSGRGPATSGGQNMDPGGSGATQLPSSSASASGSAKPPQPASSPLATPSGSQLIGACQNSSVTSVVATQTSVTGGVTYETFAGTARTACTLAGMPGLNVAAAGGVSSVNIPIYKADPTVAPLLSTAPGGQTLTLLPGDRFEFQIAWVPQGCTSTPPPTSPPSSVPPTSGTPTVSATSSGPTPSGPTSSPTGHPTPSGTPSSSAPAPVTYSVAYSVYGTDLTQSASFTASCGAAVYVTNYFEDQGQRRQGQLPTAPASGH